MKNIEQGFEKIFDSHSQSILTSEYPNLKKASAEYTKEVCIEFIKQADMCTTTTANKMFENFIKQYKQKLTNEEYVRCILSVMNFLVFGDGEQKRLHSFDTPSNDHMIHTLEQCGYDSMESFTIHLANGGMWNSSSKEFFSDKDTSLKFFSEQLNNYLSAN